MNHIISTYGDLIISSLIYIYGAWNVEHVEITIVDWVWERPLWWEGLLTNMIWV